MKQFLINITIFFLSLLIVLYTLSFFVDSGLKNLKSIQYHDWNLLFDGKINADIIILGSSRAIFHYDPKIIETKTNMSCYNLGIDGARIQIQKTRWKSYLKYNKKPQIIIQNIDLPTLEQRTDIYNKEQFSPYIQYKSIYKPLKQIDSSLWKDKYFPCYKYHGYPQTFIKGLISFLGIKINEDYNSYKGFRYQHKKWTDDFEKFKSNLPNESYTIDTIKLKKGIEDSKELIKYCEQNEITLIFVHAPMYIELQNIMPQKNIYMTKINSSLNQSNSLFWDFSKDSLSYSTDFFYNSMHLNAKGAEIFTTNFTDSLSVLLNKKFSSEKTK